MRVINLLLGRPSLIKATLCSLLLHVGTIAAAYYCWSKPDKHVSFAGQRNTVFLEAALSEHRPEEHVEVRLEADPKPIVKRIEHDPAPFTALDISPREMPLAKRETVVELERPAQHEVVRKVVDVGELVAHVAPTRRANESIDMTTSPTAAPSQLPRQSAEPPSPRSIIAVEQVASVEGKKPPDFSGNRPPSYPSEAIRRRLEGTVVLRLHVASTGNVERVEIVKSSGHSVLDQAAVSAVRAWRGQPAYRGNRAVATEELLPVRFRF